MAEIRTYLIKMGISISREAEKCWYSTRFGIDISENNDIICV